MSKRAALYARVSTPGQLDNTSPDSQLERCRQYTRERGYSVVTERIEQISGTFVLARSVFNELLNMGADGLLDVIVADIPDRLGRGDAIAKCELLAQMNGLTIEYASPGRDTSTVEGLVQYSAEQMVSGIERLNIARRTKQGRRDIVSKQKRVLGQGPAPYGYKFVRHFDDLGRKVSVDMVLSESEAPIVRRIFEWSAIDGLSNYEIAKRLTEDRTPTPKNSDVWRRSTVDKILKNETYAGTWHYCKYDQKRHDAMPKVYQTCQKRDKSEWLPVSVPAIVSQDIFDQAQKKLASRKFKGNKPTTFQYLLRGRIRCGHCHGRLQGAAHTTIRKDGFRYLYYRCRRHSPDLYGEKCLAKPLRADIADSLVWNKIKERLKDEHALFEGIEAQREESENAIRMIQATIAALESENQKTQDKISRWLDLYGDGGMTKEQYHAKCKTVEGEIARRNAEIADWQTKLADYHIISPDQQAELEVLRQDIVLGIDNATFDDKRKYLEWLQVECIYDDQTGDITISGVFGCCIVNTGLKIRRRSNTPSP